jgi:hypothetical protein
VSRYELFLPYVLSYSLFRSQPLGLVFMPAPFYVAYQADSLSLYSYVLRVDIAQRIPTSERKYITMTLLPTVLMFCSTGLTVRLLGKYREFLPLSYRTYSPFVSLARADWIVSTLRLLCKQLDCCLRKSLLR